MTKAQRRAMALLCDGWQCHTGGVLPPRFHALLHYPFHHSDRYTYVAGNTLASLQKRDWITWEPATLTFAYDGSTYPGFALRLTAAGQAVCQPSGSQDAAAD